METSTATAVVTPTKREQIKAAVERKGKLDVKRGTIEPGKRANKAKATPAAKPTKPKAEAKRGAKSLLATLTPTQIKEEIEMLLGDLGKETNPETKKAIRRKLRLRGHKGGLGVVKVDAK